MKRIIIGVAIATTGLTACNNNREIKQKEVLKDTSVAVQQETKDSTGKQTVSVVPVKEIIADYLQIKNALAKDNGKDAATAGNALIATLSKVDTKNLPEQKMKSYMDVAGDIKEQAEHIGAHGGKIELQRQYFIMLSKDIADLIKSVGNDGQILYKDFCPMANDGKGATWISEVKEIKNPYLGSKMPDCGTVKENIK